MNDAVVKGYTTYFSSFILDVNPTCGFINYGRDVDAPFSSTFLDGIIFEIEF